MQTEIQTNTAIHLTKRGESYCADQAQDQASVSRRYDAIAARVEYYLERVSRLCALLDSVDGDPNMEPSLGSEKDYWPATQEFWGRMNRDDQEYDVGCDRHDGDELEKDEAEGGFPGLIKGGQGL